MRTRTLVALMAVLALLAAACGGKVDTSDQADDTEDTVQSDDATDTEDETDDTVSDEEDLGPVDAPEDYHEVLELTLVDLQEFWTIQMPEVYGIEYTPIPEDELYPYDEDSYLPPCGEEEGELSYEDMADNAFYCPLGPFVAWDEGTLFPAMNETYGPYAIAMVIAHEWGHAVQDQGDAVGSTILLENQADCFAGAWTAWIDSGESEYLELEPGDLEFALAGMLDLRDEPGTPADDPYAHGSGFDRVSAFQDGFTQGPQRCAAYPEEPPVFVPLLWDEEELLSDDPGDLPVDELVEITVADLDDYWTLLAPAFDTPDAAQPIDLDEDELPTCGDELTEDDIRLNIFYCAAEDYVAWDVLLLEQVHDEIGDFGSAVLLANQWAVSAQIQYGLREETIDTALQRDCFSGSWTGNIFNYTTGGAESAGREAYIALSAGDLDEVVQSFIAFSVPAGEAGAEELGTAFQRINAFRDGFFQGFETCRAYVELGEGGVDFGEDGG